MGVDYNAIFGYGFSLVLYKYVELDARRPIDSDEEDNDVLDTLQEYCKLNKLDLCVDMYDPHEVFIGKVVAPRVQNGTSTYSKNNGWFSKKDLLTQEKSCTFTIKDHEYILVQEAFSHISKFNEDKPRWMIFTYKD